MGEKWWRERVANVFETGGVGELGVHHADHMIPRRNFARFDIMLPRQAGDKIGRNQFTKLTEYGMIQAS